MRILIIATLALLVGGALATAADDCPSGYEPCGRGVCCPK